MARISNSSTIDLVRASLGTQASPDSMLFFGLPLLRGTCCWGDGASTVFSSCAASFTLASARCDIILSVGRGRYPFGSLGVLAVRKKES
jgi:hypothetical protein